MNKRLLAVLMLVGLVALTGCAKTETETPVVEGEEVMEDATMTDESMEENMEEEAMADESMEENMEEEAMTEESMEEEDSMEESTEANS